MEALGYDVPAENINDEEYFDFVADVKEAVNIYELRDRLAETEAVGEISDVSDIDLAEAAFNLHNENKFSFDLTEVREAERRTRVVDVPIPRGLYEKIEEITNRNLLYMDEEDFIKTKIREAVQEEEQERDE